MKHAWINHIEPHPGGQTAGSLPQRYECQNCGLVTEPHDYRDHGPLRSWLDAHPPCIPPELAEARRVVEGLMDWGGDVRDEKGLPRHDAIPGCDCGYCAAVRWLEVSE